MLSEPVAFISELHREKSRILMLTEKIIEHDLIAFPDRKITYILQRHPAELALITCVLRKDEAVNTCMYSVGYSDEIKVIMPL